MGCGGSKDAQREADYQAAVKERQREEEKVVARCVPFVCLSARGRRGLGANCVGHNELGV
jgi:hypothetical protein